MRAPVLFVISPIAPARRDWLAALTSIGFLHTSPVHVATYRALLADVARARERVAVVAAVQSTLGPTRELWRPPRRS